MTDEPDLDRERLRAVFGDDVGAAAEVVLLAIEEGSEQIEAARRAVASGDLEAAREVLHALRGAAGNVGAVAVASAAGECEAAARAGDATRCAAQLAELEDRFAALREAAARLQTNR